MFWQRLSWMVQIFPDVSLLFFNLLSLQMFVRLNVYYVDLLKINLGGQLFTIVSKCFCQSMLQTPNVFFGQKIWLIHSGTNLSKSMRVKCLFSNVYFQIFIALVERQHLCCHCFKSRFFESKNESNRQWQLFIYFHYGTV